MRSILIIGHRQPDTDSICSVIGYAELLNATSPESYVPARCGELNGETSFALSRFGVEPPLFVESVEPNVSDLPFTYLVSAGEDVPAIDVAAMMEQHDMRNMPITDAGGRLVGLVSEHGLAVAYVRRIDREQLSLARIRLETLARILDAGILVNASEILEGNVYIAIDALHVALSRLTRNDVAVVGDNEPSQLALISAGIAALIIADGAPVGERVITAAKEKGVSILATRLDAFGAGKMIHLSLPAREVMTTDVPRVDMQDSLEYAKQIATNNPYRTACVTDKDGMLLVMISRNTLLDEVQKPVILLDHNEYSLAVDGIEDAEILEIIDHHRLGAISTLKPVRFLNDPVGSTCTIITRKFVEAGVIPTPAIAGLLLSGILSDTLVLKMSTTTDEDRRAVEYLSGIAGVDPVAFGSTLIQEGMEYGKIPLDELLTRDAKEYSLFGKEVIIAQVMVASQEYPGVHAGEIRTCLDRLRKSRNVDLYMALFTDVIGNESELYTSGEQGVLSALGYADQPVRFPGVMSRKKDFLPGFGQKLRNLGI